MQLRRFQKSGAAPVAAIILLAGAVSLPAQADRKGPPPDPARTVVASGLDNPRHLSVGTGGIFVAEAGRGGDGPCLPNPEGGETCFGTTGAITQLRGRYQSRIVTGLPSLAGPGGAGAQGPTDVLVQGNRVTVSLGLGQPTERRATLPAAGQELGTVRLDRRRGHVNGDLAAFEAAGDPDGAGVDSNPGGLDTWRGRTVVADAGANTILTVDGRGTVSLVATMPGMTMDAPEFLGMPPGSTIPAQSVPTDVEVGPDGALYVAELTGFPFQPGKSSVYRIGRDGTPRVWATGLTNVTDLEWAGRTLYAVQLADAGLAAPSEGPPQGSLVTIGRGDTVPRVVAGSLTAPYGVVVQGRYAYVTTCAMCAGTGEVVRIRLPRR